jgi:SAM domain (Sterile alpha motif)
VPLLRDSHSARIASAQSSKSKGLDTLFRLEDHVTAGAEHDMDLGELLRSLGLDQYEAAFRENGIDPSVLPDLTDQDLEKLGVLNDLSFSKSNPRRLGVCCG